MKDEFYKSLREAFKDKTDDLIRILDKPYTSGFFINEAKANRNDILNFIDFKYQESDFNKYGYYHNEDSIGKSKAFELGLIYPQDIESSYSSSLLDISPKLIVDLCAAPGGKSINILNMYKDALCVANDISYSRTSELAKNLERLGLTNTIITSKEPKELVKVLEGNVDLVILDAPCSGQGIVRKYPDVIDNFKDDNVEKLVKIQKDLLEYAYRLINKDGIILYSTCTYTLKEDENQVISFLENHKDTNLIKLYSKYNYSSLEGAIKLCPLNNSEGQFISLIKRNSVNDKTKLKYLKEVDNRIVNNYIKENLLVDKYYLYANKNNYYMSFKPLLDLGLKVIRNGIYLGELKNIRFEPSHNMYRSNELIGKYKKIVNLDDKEYDLFIQGLEIKKNIEDGYYLVTYHKYSLGFVKCSNNVLKNKYPKGLRRAVV